MNSEERRLKIYEEVCVEIGESPKQAAKEALVHIQGFLREEIYKIEYERDETRHILLTEVITIEQQRSKYNTSADVAQ